MAKELILPKLGNTVESCIILEWRVKEGDAIAVGDVVCEAETDKTTVEVESEVEGTLLKLLVEEGDEAEVLSTLAVVGEEGEDVSSFVVECEEGESDKESLTGGVEVSTATQSLDTINSASPQALAQVSLAATGASPRAKNLAVSRGLDLSFLESGSGPGGRVIERDVVAALEGKAPLSQAAKGISAGMSAPVVGSGIGGRVLASDLRQAGMLSGDSLASRRGKARPDKVIAVKGVRKIVAQRMLASLQESAQLSHHSSCDATVLLEFRKRLKQMDKETLCSISINDLILYATAQTLVDFPSMNAHFLGDKIVEFGGVNLGFAVDTPRGLMVPVIKNAHAMTILEISAEASSLINACREGSIDADNLKGGTFTISNLGGFGVEAFTPVLNRPEVGILGVCTISTKPVMKGSDVEFIQSLGLSITYDHQGVDGAPAARFMKALGNNIANIDLLVAGLC